MPRNSMKREPIPKHFRSVEAAAEFWDSHDLTDYSGSTRDAHFRVDVRRRVFLTALDPELAKKLTTVARKRGISTETLINMWLAERTNEPACVK